jgi:hypothetical protein
MGRCKFLSVELKKLGCDETLIINLWHAENAILTINYWERLGADMQANAVD